MAITIKIYVSGLAAIYREGNAQKNIFLTEPQIEENMHKLDFRWKEDGGDFSEPKALAGKDAITLEYSDPIAPDNIKGKDFKKIFNLNSVYAHRNNLLRKNSGTWRQTEMIVPQSKLSLENETPKEYGIRESTDPPDAAYPIGKVAKEVRFDIEIKTGGLVMKVSGEEDLKLNQDGAAYTLIFDNECHSCTTADGDDFKFYYELVQDEVTPDLKFTAGKIQEDAFGFMLLVPDGNCDPIVIEPPPGD